MQSFVPKCIGQIFATPLSIPGGKLLQFYRIENFESLFFSTMKERKCQMDLNQELEQINKKAWGGGLIGLGVLGWLGGGGTALLVIFGALGGVLLYLDSQQG